MALLKPSDDLATAGNPLAATEQDIKNRAAAVRPAHNEKIQCALH
jgi:hypothetical protein